MAKEANLMLRICSDDKGRIVAAAKARGKSVTDFVLGAAMRLASTVESKVDDETLSGLVYGPGVPRPSRIFRSLCATARNGGPGGYLSVGWEIAHRCCPGDVRELWLAGQKGREPAILQWFTTRAPTYLAMVPKRRQSSFATGAWLGVRSQVPKPVELQPKIERLSKAW